MKRAPPLRIALGPDSPLKPASRIPARRYGKTREFDVQRELVARLVGPAIPGVARSVGRGLTLQHPELVLLYAIPNGGTRNKKAAGRAKGEGVLAGMCDLCLPVPRAGFAGLYVEMKAEGEYGGRRQRAIAEALRAQGYAVMECQGVKEGLDAFLAYLALPASILDTPQLREERATWHAQHSPNRRMR
jgi:hypothetical protein